MNAKRIISLLLTAAMLAGLLLTGAVSAFAADDTVIDYIEVIVSGVEEGKSTDGVTITVPEGAPYTAKLNGAGIYDYTEGMTPFTGTFGKTSYRVDIYVEPKAGYTILEDKAEFVIKGDGIQVQSAFLRDSDAYGLFALYDLTTPIDSIEVLVSGVEEGKSTDSVTITVPEGAGYTVRVNGSGFDDISDGTTAFTGIFGKDRYLLTVFISSKPGYTIPEDVEWVIKGDGIYQQWLMSSGSGVLGVCASYDFRTPIDKAELTVTGVEEGKSTADVKVTFPEGANYALDRINIKDSDGAEFAGAFGKDEYSALVVLKPAEGYAFTEDAKVTINGSEASYVNVASDTRKLTTAYRANLCAPIDKVDITVTGVEEGKPSADVKVTFPEGANYSLDYLNIVDSKWQVFADTFGKDGYTADIYLKPAKGYYFADDAQVTVNGGEPDYLYIDNGYLNAEYDADFRTPIDKVEITATELKQGIDTADLKVTVPENANYILQEVLVKDHDGEVVTGKLDSYSYYYDIRVEAKKGYYLDDAQVTVLFNGGEVDYISEEGDATVLEIEKEYFFGKYIDKVELPAWPVVAAGGQTPEMILEKPEGKNYNYGTMTIACEPGVGYVPAGETFENNKAYMITMIVQAAEGYAFADKVTVTVGGETYTGIVEYMGTSIAITKMFSLGDAKVVDKITVSAEQPTGGKKPSQITAEGTGYTLEDADWGVANNDKMINVDAPGVTFRVGEHVYLGLQLKLEEGYVFDPNAKVWLGGKAYNLVANKSMVEGDNISVVIYLGQLKAATNPSTGDETPLVLLTALTVTSMLGMGLLISRRKTI